MPRRRAPGHALEAQVALRPETERFGHAEGSPRVGRGVPAECRTSASDYLLASRRWRLGEGRPWVVFFDFGAIRTVPRAGGVLEFAFCYPYSHVNLCVLRWMRWRAPT